MRQIPDTRLRGYLIDYTQILQKVTFGFYIRAVYL